MRILMITQWFQPEPHFKGLGFAKALQAMGHEVEVLTGFPNYPGGKVYPGYRVGLRKHEILDGIPVTRGYIYPSHDSSALRRIANYVSFALSSTVLALTLRKPDVVYVYTPPMTATLPAVALRLLRGVPFVPDVQDLWPDTLAATGMVNNPRVLGLIGWWTNFSFRRAARIVVLSAGFRQRLLDRGLSVPIAVVHNWAPPEIVDVARTLPSPHAPGIRPFTILFAGNMGKAQGLDVVLNAAEILQSEGSTVRFALIGGGVERGHLKQRINDLQLHNVDFHEPLHPSRMGEVFADADALLVHLREDPLFEITIPSKIQAYLAIGRPIILGVRGNAADMVRDAKAGVTFAPDSHLGLVAAVKQISALSPSDRADMGAAGQSYYNERLAFDIGVAAIERELCAAAERR
jgi:colanic acid biosynthesis glycosyl transferase WcaI